MSIKQVSIVFFLIITLLGSLVAVTALELPRGHAPKKETPKAGPTPPSTPGSITIETPSGVDKPVVDTPRKTINHVQKRGRANAVQESKNIRIKSHHLKTWKKHKVVDIPKKEKITTPPIAPTEAICTSGRSDVLLKESEDCGESLQSSEESTNVYAGRGKNHASIEVTLPVDNVKAPVVELIHEAEYPKQQEVSIYLFNEEKKVWEGVCHNLKSGKSECSLGNKVKGKEHIKIRAEGYSREGPGVWSVDHIRIKETAPPEQPPVYEPTPTISKPGEKIMPPKEKKKNVDKPKDGEGKKHTNVPILKLGADNTLVDLEGMKFSIEGIKRILPPPPPVIPPTIPATVATTEQVLALSSGFNGFNYPGFSATTAEVSAAEETNSGGETVPETTTDSETVLPSIGATPNEQPQGLLAITGAAITDLATKNVPGLLLTLAILGLVGFQGYRMWARRRRVL